MMKRKLSLATLAMAGAFLLTGCGQEKSKEIDLTIMHTNDHHGHFWQNKYGELGMAARKTLIDEIRSEVEKQGGYSLLLSGGDINTGVPESDMQNAEPDFRGMSKLGYDAMALGNHEFDNPLSVLEKQATWANFPFLAANIYDKATGKRKFKPYTILEKGGVKIALIGFTTKDTIRIANPENIKTLEFTDPRDEAKKLIPEIKANEKPDLIFAVTHMGHYQNADFGVNEPGDVSLARSLNEGDIDMIIGGHSQNPVCMSEDGSSYDANFKAGMACKPDFQNGTWIVQAHEWGKYLGRANFHFKDGKLELKEYKLIPVNLKKKIKNAEGKKVRVLVADAVAENKEMLDFLKPYQDKGTEKLSVQVGSVEGKLEGDRNVVRFQQTNLGRLIAKAQSEKVGADFGIMNSGGVRDSIQQGNITYKDVLKVQPFGNIVTKITMNGKDLKKYLDVVATKSINSGAYPQFYGISMVVKNDGVHDVVINGQPLEDEKTYSFSLPKFNTVGGDGYPKQTQFLDTGFIDAEVLKTFIEKNSPLKASDFESQNEVIFENQ